MSRPTSIGTIVYVPSDADRADLAASFGVARDAVPVRLSGGAMTADGKGVMFAEMIRGYRVSLFFAGRPALVDALAIATSLAA